MHSLIAFRSRMSPLVVSTNSPMRAREKRLGCVGGSSAYPATRAPKEFKSMHSQLPLKPVCPVMKTRLFRQKFGFMNQRSKKALACGIESLRQNRFRNDFPSPADA